MTDQIYYPIKDTTKIIGENFNWPYGKDLEYNPPSYVYGLDEHRIGENFSISHARSPDGKYRSGGPWLMYQKSQTVSMAPGIVYRPGFGVAYRGQFTVPAGTLQLLTDENQIQTWNRAWAYGASAIAALKPDKPDFGAAESLLELKDFLPGFKDVLGELLGRIYRHPLYRRQRSRAGKIYAERYLGEQFGYLPLARDIQSAFQAFHNRKKRFDQVLRDAGKPVRRRRNLYKTGNDKDSMTTSRVDYLKSYGNPNLTPTFVTQCYFAADNATLTSTYSNVKVWCAGQARYFLPLKVHDDAAWRRAIQRRILGGYLSPSDLYKLAPWSWLIDYFSNLGKFFQAISTDIADRVIFDYAYIMRAEEAQTTKVHTNNFQGNLAGTLHGYALVTARYTHVRKCRVNASLFGFGLSEGDLSPQQVAILGALGAQRL